MPIWQIFGCDNGEEARNAIKEKLHNFNKNPAYLALDYVTGWIFSQPFDRNNLTARLWMIRKHWLGRYLSDKDLYKVLQGVTPHFEDLKIQLANLRPLQHYPEEEIDNLVNNQVSSALRWFSIIRREHVLTAKFLHWSTPGTFPIIDEHAHKAIREAQINIHETPLNENMPNDPGASIEDYRKVMKFYRNLIDKLLDRFKDWLRKEDFKQQQGKYPYLARSNSILRILDKYFWEKGGGG